MNETGPVGLSSRRTLPLVLASMGVVFGDICTSPLYALRESFAGHHPMNVSVEYVYGILSLITVLFGAKGRRSRTTVLLGVCATALFLGDSIVTPAILVLSAVVGLQVVNPAFESIVLPLVAAILIALFAVQRRGTHAMGNVFGPVILVWCVVLVL